MTQKIVSVLISSDGELRDLLVQLLGERGQGTTLGAEITVPFLEIDDTQLRKLRDVNPQLILLDLEKNPEVGIKLAQFLADQRPDRQLIATGPVLAPELLIAAMRAGITEYLPKPVSRELLSAALERTERKLGVKSGDAVRAPGKVLAFFSPKGGSGSTTIATNLAIHLQQLTGRKVLLVDLDLELGEIALFLGAQPRFNFVDLVRNFHRMDAELLASYIEAHPSGVHLLSAPYHPEKVETVTGEQIRVILRFLKQHYDYVVVDTSKSFSPATLASFEQADHIYFVSNVDLPSLRNIKRCIPLVERVTGGVENKVRLVVNRYNSATEITLEEVERTLGLKIFWKLSNDYETVMRSINTGEPLILKSKNAGFAQDLRGMVAEISGLGSPVAPKRTPLDGLRRLFRTEPAAVKEAIANG